MRPNNPNYIPRVSVNLSADQKERLQAHVPWGLINQVYVAITDLVLEMFDRLGPAVTIAIILEKKIPIDRLKQLLEEMRSDETKPAAQTIKEELLK